MKQETLDKHKPVLDGTWDSAWQFTNNCCFDEKNTYAMIKKTGGQTCGPGVDCDKVIERKSPYRIYDLVRNAGAPNNEPIFDYTGHNGKKADFAEPLEYDAEPQPGPSPLPLPILPGREEVMQELDHLHGVYKRELKRPEGLWKNGAPDSEGIGAWIFDVYQNARLAGATPDEARATYMAQIRDSAEWKANNP